MTLKENKKQKSNQKPTIYYKVCELIDKSATLEDAAYVIKKIQTTPKINRRTKEGRELTKELLTKADAKYREITKLTTPF